MAYTGPLIEQFMGEGVMDAERDYDARWIAQYLRTGDGKDHYYESLARLLYNEESERIILYLPFGELENNDDAPQEFKESALWAWKNLLLVYDARANFYDGDAYEPDARKGGEPERVVKAAHLAPWMLGAQLLKVEELIGILEDGQDDAMLLSSFRDTWRFIGKYDQLRQKDMDKLESLTAKVPPREKPEPLYNSASRIKWLSSPERGGELLTPSANLAGPFSVNVGAISNQLHKISKAIPAKEIALLGGSALKGYGTVRSDYDVRLLSQLYGHPDYRPGSPDGAHLYFNSLWIGGSEVGIQTLWSERREILKRYILAPGEQRRKTLERLESDLLQYRLLHKGYRRRYPGRNCYDGYPEMDGDSPFYEEGYRRIATELFAKYVYLPELVPSII